MNTPITDSFQDCHDGTFLPAMERLELDNQRLRQALREVKRDLTASNGLLGTGEPGSIYDALECESREHWAKVAIAIIDTALANVRSQPHAEDNA